MHGFTGQQKSHNRFDVDQDIGDHERAQTDMPRHPSEEETGAEMERGNGHVLASHQHVMARE